MCEGFHTLFDTFSWHTSTEHSDVLYLCSHAEMFYPTSYGFQDSLCTSLYVFSGLFAKSFHCEIVTKSSMWLSLVDHAMMLQPAIRH